MRLQKQNQLTNPRGLRADDAAAYLGMGKTKFLELVDKGMIPRRVHNRQHKDLGQVRFRRGD